jgi:ferrous iron transport protein A
MKLTQLKTGDIAKIIDIDGGCHHLHKLCLRGITEGSIVRVISNMGPVTVEIDRNVVSIGRGMADRIMVMRV